VVDGSGGGDFTTVSAAVKAAGPGDTIMVRPGFYADALYLDQPLQVVGDGDREDIVITASGDQNVLESVADGGRVANLTLRQASGPEERGVLLHRGQLVIEDCDISSDSGTCVQVLGDSDPALRRNVIHDGREYCLRVSGNARGTFEDNQVIRARYPCVIITGESDPVFRRNLIREATQAGLFILGNARGTYEDNEVCYNKHSGIRVNSPAGPVIRGNRVHDNGTYGVHVEDKGSGAIHDNVITLNHAGWFRIERKAKHNVTRGGNT
jgi:F-box protein 11